MARKSELSLETRENLEKLLKAGYNINQISKILNMNRNTLYYEVKTRTKPDENGNIDYKNYSAAYATLKL